MALRRVESPASDKVFCRKDMTRRVLGQAHPWLLSEKGTEEAGVGIGRTGKSYYIGER